MSPSTMLLTIDVEDWFHLEGGPAEHLFKDPPRPGASQRTREERIEFSLPWMLDRLETHNTRGTFFVLGCVADGHPQLIREIDRRGHRVASHGYNHTFITQQRPEEFRSDLVRSIRSLEDLIGQKVLGYRAPYCSITERALDIMADEGLLYDASYYPAAYHDLYARIPALEKSQPIERLPNGLWEVRMSSLFIGRHAVPWGGGGYFRLMPYSLFCRGMRYIQRHQGLYQFYIHPWELDPETPRLEGLKALSRLRRYSGLHTMRARFENLLREFRFIPIEEALAARTGCEPEPELESELGVTKGLR